MNKKIKAILWDFGGVFTTSPFEMFNRFEYENNLPKNFIRQVNQTNPNNNAWAKFERADISATTFDTAFAEESSALGHHIAGSKVIKLLRGKIRPEMVWALRQCKALKFKTACITNNVQIDKSIKAKTNSAIEDIFFQTAAIFDYVVESSKVGIRKPDPKIYLMACDALEIEPHQAVYLDDLGINLKPARALGMKTIKVIQATQALKELELILDVRLTRLD